MAIKAYSNIDLHGNELKNSRVDNINNENLLVFEGQIGIDTSVEKLKYKNISGINVIASEDWVLSQHFGVSLLNGNGTTFVDYGTSGNVNLGGFLTQNTSIDGNSTHSLSLTNLSSFDVTTSGKASIASSYLGLFGILDAPFRFINDTGTDSAGRELFSISKKWTGAGAPDGNNGLATTLYLPNTALANKTAWSNVVFLINPAAGNEYSLYQDKGFHAGTLVNMSTLGNFLVGLGNNHQVIGTGDIAIGSFAKAWNGSQIALGQNAGDTTGAATGKTNTISIGSNANSGISDIGIQSISIGYNSKSISDNSIAIGQSSSATGNGAIAIGSGAITLGQDNIAIGAGSKTSTFLSIAIGNIAGNTTGIDNGEAVSFGYGSNSGTYDIGQRSVAVGSSSIAKGTNSVSIGYFSGNTTGIDGNHSISLGFNSNSGTSNIGGDSIAIGVASKSISDNSIAIGQSSSATGNGAIAIGSGAITIANQSIAIGTSAGSNSGTVNATNISIGYQSNNGSSGIGQNSIAFGPNTSTLTDASIAIGNGAAALDVTNGGANISIGVLAGATTGITALHSISLGYQANAGTANIGASSIAIGASSKSVGSNSVAIGTGTISNSNNSISIGQTAGSTTGVANGFSISIGNSINAGTSGIGLASVSLGYFINTVGDDSVSIGNYLNTTAINAISIGVGSNTSQLMDNNINNSFAIGLGETTPDYQLIKGKITTSNNTTVTILTFTLTSGFDYSLKATIIARDQAGVERALFVKHGLFYREGAGAVQEGATASVITDIHTNNAIAASFAISGNDVLVQVTGLTAVNFNWKAILEVIRVF